MSLRLERHGAVAHLVIDRTTKRNAITGAMWAALPGLVDEGMADEAVRALVVRAAEPGPFSAGADIGEFAANAGDPAWAEANRAAIRGAQLALTGAAKPVIAQIEGDCIGAGCGIALACDLRVAAPAARFGITPAKLGLAYPLHDTRLLVDLVGPAQAKRLLFTAGLIDATEAHRIGLADIIADDAGAAVATLVETISSVSAFTCTTMKGWIGRILAGQRDDDAETNRIFVEAFAGADCAEGVAAFRAKRPPAFR